MLVTDALAIYAAGRGPELAGDGATDLAHYLARLIPFWTGKTCADVTRDTCREYVVWAGVSDGAARRYLSVLTAAMRWLVSGGAMSYAPTVHAPPAAAPRERWLSRSEAARLLHASRGVAHLSTFIVLGLRTGTRSGATLALQWQRNPQGGWVDLEHGVLYRAAERERATKKRKPPVRLSARTLRHLAKVRERTRTHVIEYGGKPVTKVRRAWARARELASLGPEVTPHTLRHTAITWAMQRRADIYEASGYFGVDVRTMFRVYAHHHPDFGSSVIDAIG